MAVKFKALDAVARTATFTVDAWNKDGTGADVVRRIPAQFVGTIDDYLAALARGLETEQIERVGPAKKPIGATTFKAGDEPTKLVAVAVAEA